MNTARTISTVLVMLPVAFGAIAQESDSRPKLEASASVDLVSGYIWRGQDLGGVSIQPGGSIGYYGFSLSAWGSSGFESKDTKEVDFTLGYAWKGLSVSITDYWFNNGPNYFHYAAHDTAHVWEAHVGYDFGFMALNWYTNFAGNDGVTTKGKRAYSSYVEVSAPFRIGVVDFKGELGATPYSTSFYNARGFAVTNVSLQAGHTFDFKEWCSLTVFAKATCNPRDEKMYMVGGVSFGIH